MMRTSLQMAEFQCPGCLRSDGNCIGNSRGADVYQCRQCGLCFLSASARPRAEKDNHWYGDVPLTREAGARFLTQMGTVYRRQLELIASFRSGPKILDFGCGLGVFLAVAKEQGWDPIGIETSPHAIRFVRDIYGVRCEKDLEQISADSMDVVRLSHTLEHIPEPIGLVSALRKKIANRGLMVIVVPNREPLCEFLVNSLRRMTSDTPRLAGSIYPDMHVLGFSPLSLRNLLESQGFHTEKLFCISMGARAFFPWFYDGLLSCKSPLAIPLKSAFRYWLPRWLNNFGNTLGRGDWIVGYFRKR